MMAFGSSRLNMYLAVLCAFSFLLNTVNSESASIKKSIDLLKKKIESSDTALDGKTDALTRRQDNGFDFMNMFLGRQQQPQQNQQQVSTGQQQSRQGQQPLTVQQQHQLQQQQLSQQQLQQQQQLQKLQQQQLLQLQQQQQVARSNEVYQDNVAQQQQQQQQQQALNRNGGYGPVGIGNGYQQPNQIGISIGAGKPPNVIGVGNILTLLPRIINILSAGGKVMFGVELGNNFYFGPVGAKPLYG